MLYVDTLRNVDRRYSKDEIISEWWERFPDGVRPEGCSNREHIDPLTVEANTDIQEEVLQEPVVAGATTEGNDSQEAKPSPAKAKPNERDVTSESKVATDGESNQLINYTRE